MHDSTPSLRDQLLQLPLGNPCGAGRLSGGLKGDCSVLPQQCKKKSSSPPARLMGCFPGLALCCNPRLQAPASVGAVGKVGVKGTGLQNRVCVLAKYLRKQSQDLPN